MTLRILAKAQILHRVHAAPQRPPIRTPNPKTPEGKQESVLTKGHACTRRSHRVIESRGHLRGGEINRKVLAMANIPEKHKRYGLLPLSVEAMLDAQSREPEGQGNAIQDRG